MKRILLIFVFLFSLTFAARLSDFVDVPTNLLPGDPITLNVTCPGISNCGARLNFNGFIDLGNIDFGLPPIVEIVDEVCTCSRTFPTFPEGITIPAMQWVIDYDCE